MTGPSDVSEHIASDLMDRVAYYKELARLRGELVGYLMSGNRALGASLIHQIQQLEGKGSYPEGRGVTAMQKQNLKDALASMTNAVKDIVG